MSLLLSIIVPVFNSAGKADRLLSTLARIHEPDVELICVDDGSSDRTAAYVHLDCCELQHGYFYVQEFLPGNEYDIRVTVIGNRAFAFRRFNRPGDFRASGSGRIDWDPQPIEEEGVRLAFRVARRLRTQSLAVDLLQHRGRKVLAEISYAYASWAVRDCPGHWVLQGDADTGPLSWIEGRMHPDDAIFDDFVARLGSRDAKIPCELRP